MIAESKDSIANITTIAGSGSIFLNWNQTLTLLLIATGIILNIVRIIEIRRARKKDQD